MNTEQKAACIAAVTFDGRRTYDYLSEFPLKPGQNVVVETKRGEAVVSVVEVKQTSSRATAWIKRVEETLF